MTKAPAFAPVIVHRGHGPLILGLPHGGTHVPPDIATRLNDTGAALADTDWHIARLYENLYPGVTTVAATFHRYVIDANRDPTDVSLYPGQNTTSLCPVTDFDGQPIWCEGAEPSATDILKRLMAFHTHYHAALNAEIARVRQRHGHAIVYDCHSIRSHIPFLFEGTLPDLNIGTNNGVTCDPMIVDQVVELATYSSFSSVLNGRFKGGWTTRHYGQPSTGVHAIQMEIAQSAYLETEAPPWTYSTTKAARLRPVLANILDAIVTASATLPKL